MENKSSQIEILKQDFNKLISEVEVATKKGKRIDQVESTLLTSLLAMGKHVLQLYIVLVNEKTEESFKKKRTTEHYRNKGMFKRTYFSIFGSIEFMRKKYYVTPGKQIEYSLDKFLCLPDGKYSYLLQNWIGNNATDTDFRASVELLNRILGQKFSEMQSERISNKLSSSVEKFYQQKERKLAPKKDKKHTSIEYRKPSEPEEQEGIKAVQQEGTYFAAGFDDKGIAILPSEMNREAESTGVRLGKGEKKGVTKSSTVSVTYSFDPFIRSAEDVVSNLFKETTTDKKNIEPSEPKKTTENKHIRAFMSDKEKAINYGLENALKRGCEKKKPIVLLIDGDRGLEKAIDRVTTNKAIEHLIVAKVLDIIHVLEYLWKAANAHFGEKSPKRIEWVKKQCLLILQSRTKTVIKNLKQLIKQNKRWITNSIWQRAFQFQQER